MQVRLSRSNLGSSLELSDGVGRLPQPIQRLAGEYMRGGRIRVLLQNLAKLVQRTRILLGPQAALRQDLMKLGVARVGLHRDFEVLDGFREALDAIATEAQQRPRLHVLWFHFQRGGQGWNGRVEVSLLELG